MNNRLNSDEIIKLLDQLIGPVEAVGDSRTDEYIKENLLIMINVADWMLDCIDESSLTANRPEWSMKEIGNIALAAIKTWKERLEGIVDEWNEV